MKERIAVEPEPQRDEQEVVEVAEDRDRIRDEVERAQRVRHGRHREGAGVPRRARVAGGQRQRMQLAAPTGDADAP